MATICEYLSDIFVRTLDEMLSDFKSKPSVNNYKNIVNAFCNYTKKDFLETSKEDVKSYFGDIQGKSSDTKSVRFSTLKSIAMYMDSSLGTKITEMFTGIDLDERKVYTELKDLPEFEDIDKVLTVLKETEDSTTFAIMTLALETGLNLNDILSLRYNNFFADKNGSPIIRIEPKVEGALVRNIPLSQKTALLIDSIGRMHLESVGTDPIFRNSHGRAISDRLVQLHINAACKKAGVAPFGISKIRQLAMASMLKGGASIKALSYALDESGTWFFSLNHVVRDLPQAAAAYNHIKVEW